MSESSAEAVADAAAAVASATGADASWRKVTGIAGASNTCRNVTPDEAWDYSGGFCAALDMGLQDFRDTDQGSMHAKTCTGNSTRWRSPDVPPT